MLKVDLASQKFVGLTPLFLAQEGFKERQDLQRWIRNSSDAFFDYIGEPLLILGEEVVPSDTVMDRIDLLAIDSDGEVVIIELKRGSNKWQLSQALSYAAMISKWGQGDSFLTNVKTISKDALKDFLGTDTSEVNSAQRVILIAEAYDFEVLVTAEWLTEKYGLDIRCYQISLGQDMSHNAVYVSCACLYPPGDLAELAVNRKVKPTAALGSKSWAERLDRCENRDIKQFFEEQLRLKTRKTANDSALAYPATGTIHWNVEIRSKRALVVQVGRFQTAGGEDDESFWQKHLTTPELAKLRNGANLRFFLVTPGDLQFFGDVVRSMPELTWLKTNLGPE
jgi:hypothetical protein